MPEKAVHQRATKANTNRLDTCNTVNTVHKVVKIEQPYQIKGSQQITEPTQINYMAEHLHRWQTIETEQSPSSSREMPKQAPAGCDMPMIIKKTKQCDKRTSTAQCIKVLSLNSHTHGESYTQRKQEGHNNSHATAPRRRLAMGTACVRNIHQAARQRIAPQPSCQYPGQHSN